MFGRLGRGALWVAMPAAGLASSLRHRRHEREKREDTLLEALDRAAAGPEVPLYQEIARRRKEITRRIDGAGLDRHQARTQLAHLTAGEGMTVDEALDRIAPP